MGYSYIHNASIVLGILVVLICYFSKEIPEKHRKVWLYLMPVMVITNYYAMEWTTHP